MLLDNGVRLAEATPRLALFSIALLQIGSPIWAQDNPPGFIDQRLNDLRQIALPPPLPEIPNDETRIPPDFLAVVSWNVQVGGVSSSQGALRPPMVGSALRTMFGGSYQVLAAQEVSGTANSDVLRGLLPGGGAAWRALFVDTTDTQDNGFWINSSVHANRWSTLFVRDEVDARGRPIVDSIRTTHPPAIAHLAVGDFDFTLITVHLTFADGETEESAREFGQVLDYVDAYFTQPESDPDLVICGDFNIPTRLSDQMGRDGVLLDPIFEQDPRFMFGNRRLVATVHDATSRSPATSGGMPRSSYDHCILSADALEEFIQARRVDPGILTQHREDPEIRLTSNHFPIVALFRTSGDGVQLDVGPAQEESSITGVVEGASFRSGGVAAGSWMSIFGTNLAGATRIWGSEEIVDGVLPSSLDGVSVNVNGRPAAIFFISPGQLNVQAPDDTALGPVSVDVIQGSETVASSVVELRTVSPGLFAFESQDRRYLAAVHLDGTFAGPEGLFGGGVTTRLVAPPAIRFFSSARDLAPPSPR